jgi:Na+/H+-dicarboxylate symporter
MKKQVLGFIDRLVSESTDAVHAQLLPHITANRHKSRLWMSVACAGFFGSAVFADSTEKVPIIGDFAKNTKSFYINNFLQSENLLGLTTTIVFLAILWGLYWRTYNLYVAVIHKDAFTFKGLRLAKFIIWIILTIIFPMLIFSAMFFPFAQQDSNSLTKLTTSIWAIGLACIFFLFIFIGILLNKSLNYLILNILNLSTNDFPYLSRATD